MTAALPFQRLWSLSSIFGMDMVRPKSLSVVRGVLFERRGSCCECLTALLLLRLLHLLLLLLRLLLRSRLPNQDRGEARVGDKEEVREDQRNSSGLVPSCSSHLGRS